MDYNVASNNRYLPFRIILYLALFQYPVDADIAKVETLLLDDAVTTYATFQSHNQKVVSHPDYGVFLTHLNTRNEAYTAQHWRLLHSSNDPKKFSVLFEATDATNPPVIEIDSNGNLYLIRMDFKTNAAILYRFLSKDSYTSPKLTEIPNAAAGKYSMALDEKRKLLYLFSHNNTFHTLSMDGELLESKTLIQAGENAVLQYPLLVLANNGDLHAGWTTQKKGVYMYWDNHHMYSPDAGKSWRNIHSEELLELPVVVDDTGPALQMSAEDEFEFHSWLSSIAVNQGKLHSLYMAETTPHREHYQRYDITTGEKEKHISPTFSSSTLEIKSLGAFFSVHKSQDNPGIYAIGHYQGKVVCLYSPDNGDNWQDHAVSDESYNVYSIGGARYISEDGYIHGTFTDQKNGPEVTDSLSKLYYFKIKVH